LKYISFNFFGKILRDQKVPILVIAFFAMIFEYLFAWVFFESEASSFVENYLQFLPSIVTKLIGIQVGSEYFSSQMLAFGYEHPIILMTLIFLPISIPARYISGEIENRTFDLFLTRPIHRLTVVVTIIVFLMIITAVNVTMMYLGTIISYYQYTLNINPRDFLRAAITSYFFYLGFAAMGMCISVFVRERGRALAWSIGLIVFLFFIDTIIRLSDSLTFLLRYSYFNLYKAGEIILNRSDANISIIFCALLSVILFSIVLVQFNRRDM